MAAMLSVPKIGQVVWCRHNKQWIRVVLDFVYLPDQAAVVRPLFPGDSLTRAWTTSIADLQEEQPPYDVLSADDDVEGEFV